MKLEKLGIQPLFMHEQDQKVMRGTLSHMTLSRSFTIAFNTSSRIA